MRYDTIIIGAGSAGATLAGRLCEDSARSVLLIEAGPDYQGVEYLPAEILDGNAPAANGSHVWRYAAIANDYQEEPVQIIYGKVTGGSSAVNGCIFLRGVPEDYDGWASKGNPEWSYEKVLPYFCKLETDLDFLGQYHGRSGPISVQRRSLANMVPTQQAFHEACLSAGFPVDPDLNLPSTTGVGPQPLNNIDGLRISTNLAYLNPNRDKLNLTIKGGVTARKILFDNQRAIGVEIQSNGELFTVYGDEIIVSAGVVRSPALLMQSGIGPADQLEGLGIPVVQDLPGVGENLQDHAKADILYELKGGISERPAPGNIYLRYTASGSSDRNDMIICPTSTGLFMNGSPYTRFVVLLQSARSAGKLTLNSADPNIHPRINYRYLMNSWDLDRMREGVRLAIQLTESSAFQRSLGPRISPEAEILKSDKILSEWLLARTTPNYHAGGTCKMGPVSDSWAVVDQYCRVYGLQGLRIVDASVMPDVIRANPNATVIMIAERVADWIKTLN